MASSPETGSSRQPSSFRYRRIAPFAAALAVAAAGAVACVGSVGESWNEHGGSGGGPGGGGGAGGTGGGAGGAGGGGDGTGVSSAPLLDCSHPTSGPAPLRRLTQSEYNATVRDLLGDTTHPADGFPPDQQIGDFTNTAVALTVPPLLAQAYQAAAEQLATHAVAQLTTLLPCNPSKVGEDACAQQFIHVFGPKAFRRPLRSDEEASLFTLYQSNRDGADFTNGVQAILEAVLQSASFLYRPEFGVGTADPKGLLLLGPYETASRLSYLVWGSMPDDALFAAAAAGALATGGQVADQARRLLTDPKAKPAAREFFLEWLSVNQLASSAKDSTTYPEYTPQLEAAMQGETSSFVDYVLWQSDGKLATLLTSPVSFVNADLAKLYGLAGVTGSAVRQVTLDPTQRAGILTQPALMTRLGKADRSSPVLRGKFVRERLLCQTIDPPPFDVVITPPPVTPGVSTREMFAAHEQVQPCKGCHTLMDPIGFGFESFDGIGRYRTTDQGQKVDASGKLTLSDVNGDFNGAVALAQKLARSEDVSECLSTEWFRYGVGRGETGDDACAIASVKKAAAGGADMKEVLVAIAQSDSFRYRPEVK